MITYALNEADAQKVIDAVAALPYREVHQLVQNLLAQAQQQVQQRQAGLSPAPADVAAEEAASEALAAPQKVPANGRVARA